MPLNNYQKLAYRWFGNTAENIATSKLKEDLEHAHINMRAGAYLSYVWLNTILVAVTSVVISFSLFLFLSSNIFFIILFILVPISCTILSYFFFLNYPSTKAKARGKKIDVNLPYALNFISAMSSAGITPTEIFKSLSKQKIYGEIREEALWIYRDVGLLGKDILSAIRANIERTPSKKFKEFLQGTIVTVQSGGALRSYFISKAEQYTRENRFAQKQFLETLSIMAETYVTAAVAGILLLLVVIPIMMIVSGVFDSTFLYIIIFVLVPLVHFGFGAFLLSISFRV